MPTRFALGCARAVTPRASPARRCRADAVPGSRTPSRPSPVRPERGGGSTVRAGFVLALRTDAGCRVSGRSLPLPMSSCTCVLCGLVAVTVTAPLRFHSTHLAVAFGPRTARVAAALTRGAPGVGGAPGERRLGDAFPPTACSTSDRSRSSVFHVKPSRQSCGPLDPRTAVGRDRPRGRPPDPGRPATCLPPTRRTVHGGSG